MKSSALGKNISEVEVLQISRKGIWLYVKGVEYYLPFKQFPWFKGAKVWDIFNVKLLRGSSLHWPDLDVDLELESLRYPSKYPLVYS